MALFETPRITFSARAVRAAGHPFQIVGEPLSDFGVARDVIHSMLFGDEPTVLHVHIAGEDAQTRGWGEWLCLGDGPPRRVPAPSWSFDQHAVIWSRRQGSWIDAWELSADARHLLHAAAEVGADGPSVVLAACACAREAFGAAPSGQDAHLRAVEAAEAWARGEGGRTSANDLGRAASTASLAADRAVRYDAQNALRAAAHAAWAASSLAEAALGGHLDVVTHARVCSLAASWAIVALTSEDFGHDAALRHLAGIVRRNIPTVEVLRAACGA